MALYPIKNVLKGIGKPYVRAYIDGQIYPMIPTFGSKKITSFLKTLYSMFKL